MPWIKKRKNFFTSMYWRMNARVKRATYCATAPPRRLSIPGCRASSATGSSNGCPLTLIMSRGAWCGAVAGHPVPTTSGPRSRLTPSTSAADPGISRWPRDQPVDDPLDRVPLHGQHRRNATTVCNVYIVGMRAFNRLNDKESFKRLRN